MSAIRVRRYEAADRAAVREISYRTGYMGDSAAWFWSHPESFTDIWTAYYTDQEPESLFVAESQGELVGYLTGCVESRAAPSPEQAITRHAFRYGLFLRPGAAGFLWRGLADTLRQGGAPSGDLEDPRWPAHLHINLLPQARGLGAGAMLMEAWIERLEGVRSPGCHLGTLFENHRAIGFFERMGFERFGPPQLAPGMRSPSGGRHHLQLMVRSLDQGTKAP